MYEARGETRDPQHPQRIFAKRRRDMTQHAVLQVIAASVRIDQFAVSGFGHGVDGKIAPRKIFFQAHFSPGIEGETGMSRRDLAFPARERVLLLVYRMQIYRKILADLAVAELFEVVAAAADDNPVPILDRKTEQSVAYGAAYRVDFHGLSRLQKIKYVL